ncbi:MAG TPA: SIMPL domain-containing protein [Candidatus Paceibacterota bacterium]|jgi:hypothetical protein|nr:SIMPL domain-containing protein [Candidatus Paceibacterota bacterium]
MPNNIKEWFWGTFTVLLVVIVVILIFFVTPMLGQFAHSFTSSRTITVTGQGMTVATPDEADISFSVVSQGTSPDALTSDNNNKMSAVMQFVSSQGIASSDIQTTNYDLEPNYSYDKTTQRNYITGYTLTQTVQVKVRDLANVAAVLGGLTPLGVNQVGGVNFTFQNPDEFVAIARGDAMTKATQEASELAAEAGASLGPAVTIQESYGLPGPQPYPAYAMASGGGTAAVPSTVSVAPGTQTVTDNVTVTYELQ